MTVGGLSEQAFGLRIDDLLRLGDGELDRILERRMRVGPHEAVLLQTVGSVLLDDAGGLVLPVRPVGGGPYAVALIFDGGDWRPLGRVRARLACELPENGFELREHEMILR